MFFKLAFRFNLLLLDNMPDVFLEKRPNGADVKKADARSI